MSSELRLHGEIGSAIEYYATVASDKTVQSHFFQKLDDATRLFAPGNELLLGSDELSQTGVGGTFCEYMFGVVQPLADLTKPEILNRLVLIGAGYDQEGRLKIDEQKTIELSYTDIFLQGHAINNYFFFVDGLSARSHRERQKELLRCLGRTLKRTVNLSRQDDSQLAEKLLASLPEAATIYLIRLTHTKNRHYQREFQNLYYRDRSLAENAQSALEELGENLGISPYQQERIRIDVMYRHRDNYRIIDDYRKVLVTCSQQGHIDRQQHARLTRLKTLALRNQIPQALFSALDEKLQPALCRIDQEPEYTAIARDILNDLLLNKGIGNRDLIQLLFAKQHARQNHDNGFEQLLLESGQLFDEQIREGAPLSLLEDFSYIITFFDRFDSTTTKISRIAFMEDFKPDEEMLRSLLDSRQEFNTLVKGLFDRLFFDDLLASCYLGRYGRRKVLCLQQGLDEIAACVSTIARLTAQLRVLDAEEKLYNKVLTTAKERIRNRFSRYNTRAEQEELLQELNDELLVRGVISRPLEADLFQMAIHDIKKEAYYLRTLFPEIIAGNNQDLRNDFIHNSGLDYFYIEELEREYFILNQLDLKHLQQLRNGAPHSV
jgi:uncharacterized protein (TIGR04442 family)